MKSFKLFLFLATVFFTGQISAQSWTPFYPGDTVNYQADTANYITHSVWIDSMKNNGNFTTLFFNRVTVPCDTCSNIWGPLLGDQPQFLMRTMLAFPDGVYSFRDTNTFTILALADSGDVWLWDTIQGITAEVISKTQSMVFNQPDSFKTIALSSGDTMILSKTHGIVLFPELSGGNLSVTNVGIENRNLGERLPKFKDYFDFAIGDEFYHKRIEKQLQETYTYLYKSTVQEKIQSGDTLTYRLSSYGSLQYNFGPFNYIDTIEVFWTFINHPFHPANAYPRQIIPAITGCAKDYPDLYYLLKYDGESKYWQNAYAKDPILQDIYQYDIEVSSFNPFQYYRLGAGISHENCYIFEAGIEEILLAHVSGTDTFGVIPADSFLVAGIEQPVPEGVVKVFPNPFSRSINLSIEQIRFLPATFTLRDLSGRVVYKTNVQEIENDIHIPQLPDGIYLAELITREGKIWREKLVRYDDF